MPTKGWEEKQQTRTPDFVSRREGVERRASKLVWAERIEVGGSEMLAGEEGGPVV